jgi:branched-subunit amino acid aminotransferase/4-amino-4-deoxychorismate lyase
LSRVKSTAYLPNLLARREAKARGADEALFLNGQGRLAEGSASNVFLLSNNRLETPPVSAGLLPGVLRSVLLERGGEAGLSVREADLSPEDVLSAEAVFLTNSIIGITPVSRLEGAEIGGREAEAWTARLRRLLWREKDFEDPADMEEF